MVWDGVVVRDLSYSLSHAAGRQPHDTRESTTIAGWLQTESNRAGWIAGWARPKVRAFSRNSAQTPALGSGRPGRCADGGRGNDGAWPVDRATEVSTDVGVASGGDPVV